MLPHIVATRKRPKIVPYAGARFGLLESMKIVWRAQLRASAQDAVLKYIFRRRGA